MLSTLRTPTWPGLRVVSVLAAILLLLAACGADEDAAGEAAGDDTAATDTDTDGDTADQALDDDGDDGSAEPAPPDTSVPDPVLVGQLGQLLIDEPLTEEANACLVTESEQEGGFAAAVNTAVSRERLLNETEVADMVTAISGCAGAEPMVGAITQAIAFGPDVDLEACLNTAVADSGDAILLAGLTAVSVNLPIPADSQAATIDTLASCVPDDLVAGRLARDFESANGFVVAVDEECVAAGLASVDLSAFWNVETSDDGAGFEAIGDLLSDCADDPYADLLQEIPSDFEPWSGTGALAAVAPPARNGAYSEAPPMTIDTSASYQAIITTNDGEIVIDLFAAEAPETVNNFVSLARDGYFDGTIFHRVLADFMAQAGDPTGTGTGGPGYQFGDEVDTGLSFDRRGLLAMANAGPGTNGSQFFITFLPTPHLDGLHTIFGEVVEGDVVLGSVEFRDPANPTTRGEVVESIVIIEG